MVKTGGRWIFFRIYFKWSIYRNLFCNFLYVHMVIIYAGVRNGIERVSKFMMPILVVLSVIIAIYSVTRPGALKE